MVNNNIANELNHNFLSLYIFYIAVRFIYIIFVSVCSTRHSNSAV